MALKKELPQANGAKPSYWRPIQASMNFDRNDLVIEVAGYLTEEESRNGFTPITTMQYIKKVEDITDIRPELYTLMKQSNLDSEGNEQNVLVDAEDLL